MIALVDYGLGNIHALANIYKRLNIPVCAANTPEVLMRADKLILPGVGAFDWAMSRLNDSGMRACLDDLVKIQGRPVLGICVGMQMMARRSDEGVSPGLGWIDADVKRFPDVLADRKVSLPHMGWNEAAPKRTDDIFCGLETDARFYFLHSYYFLPDDTSAALATTDYGGVFASAVNVGNFYGTQFHPEKSHQWGVRLLQNFAELAR